jgi:hypothetical protein
VFSNQSRVIENASAAAHRRHRLSNRLAAAAGVVRKKLGLALVSEKTGTDRVYRIAVKNPVRKSKGNAVKATDGEESVQMQRKWPDQPLRRRSGRQGKRQSSAPPAWLSRTR